MSHPKPALVVMAAGMGSRYGGLKQVDPMGPNGEAMLDYSVFDAIRGGFGSVVFVIRKDIEEAFRLAVGSRFDGKVPVHYAFQELDKLPAGFPVPAGREKPWGTGQAILSARDVVKGSFAVINADDFYGRDAYARMAAYLSVTDPASSAFAMVGYQLRRTLSEHGSVARGICRTDAEGLLQSVDELTKIFKSDDGAENRADGEPQMKLSGDEPVSMNFWGFTPHLFPLLEELFIHFLKHEGTEMKSEFYIPKAVDKLIRGGSATVKVLETTSSWFGVTYREDKPLVQQSIRDLIASGEYPEKL